MISNAGTIFDAAPDPIRVLVINGTMHLPAEKQVELLEHNFCAPAEEEKRHVLQMGDGIPSEINCAS